MVGELERVYRYPVKSMRGEPLEQVEVDTRGVFGDRSWAVMFSDGRIASGKSTRRMRRLNGLLGYTASGEKDGVVVRSRSGVAFRVGDPDLDEELTGLAHRPVRLARESETQDATGARHFDDADIHLLSQASLHELGARLPDAASAVVDRFRPNLVLSLDPDAENESHWIGRKVAIGSDVVLDVVKPTQRCVMTTLPQGELATDKAVLRTLASDFEACLGVYARVLRPGEIKMGDAVRLL